MNHRFIVLLVCSSVGCGGGSSSGPPPPATGQACTAPDQCYAGIEGGAIQGQVSCLTQVPGGYCTHTCAADTDCCAISGECSGGRPELCGPFESTGQKYCFLSCETSVVTAAGQSDPNVYCAAYASATFTCRSTGGGAANRRICAP